MDAMRASHKAIVSEMEENHKKQIQQLMIEKEQALAEETKVSQLSTRTYFRLEILNRLLHIFLIQATLAALDAMQKAHKNEVQREILRFKNEFIKQSQQYTDSDFLLKDQKKLVFFFKFQPPLRK